MKANLSIIIIFVLLLVNINPAIASYHVYSLPIDLPIPVEESEIPNPIVEVIRIEPDNLSVGTLPVEIDTEPSRTIIQNASRDIVVQQTNVNVIKTSNPFSINYNATIRNTSNYTIISIPYRKTSNPFINNIELNQIKKIDGAASERDSLGTGDLRLAVTVDNSTGGIWGIRKLDPNDLLKRSITDFLNDLSDFMRGIFKR